MKIEVARGKSFELFGGVVPMIENIYDELSSFIEELPDDIHLRVHIKRTSHGYELLTVEHRP